MQIQPNLGDFNRDRNPSLEPLVTRTVAALREPTGRITTEIIREVVAVSAAAAEFNALAAFLVDGREKVLPGMLVASDDSPDTEVTKHSSWISLGAFCCSAASSRSLGLDQNSRQQAAANRACSSSDNRGDGGAAVCCLETVVL